MQETTSFFPTKTTRIAALLFIFILGIAIRLVDLTDLPLDFHSTRQLRSAIKARGMYYEHLTNIDPELRAFATQQAKVLTTLEPEILENLVAYTYRYTGEQLWVARIYSSLFWLIGGIFIYLLARRLTTEDGAIAAAAVYLFLPYAVIASRSFQPDPLMTMFIVMFYWAIYEWTQRSNWKFTILAGLFGGLAIFIKFPAAIFIGSAGLGAALSRKTIKEALKDPQVYAMALLGILPALAYFLYGRYTGALDNQFGGRFIPALFISPSFYIGWINMLNNVTGGVTLMLALLGLFFFDKEKQRFIFGLWGGYALFSFYFNFHIHTHDYYSLPLIPITAVSLAPLAGQLLSKLAELTQTKFLRLSALFFLLFGITASLWSTRNQLTTVDYRPQAEMWAEIKDITSIYSLAGLTQDYGMRATYFGTRYITVWPSYGDLLYSQTRSGAQAEFDKQFEQVSGKKDFFIVTDFEDLAHQPLLAEALKYYPVFAQGEGYILYQLQP